MSSLRGSNDHLTHRDGIEEEVLGEEGDIFPAKRK